MAQGQRVVEAPFLEKAAGENHQIDHDGQRCPGQGKTSRDRNDRARQRRAQATVAFAAYGDIAAPREQPPLDQEQGQRKSQQDHGEDRGAPRILLHAHDGEVDRGGQYLQIAAEQ